MLAFQGGVVFSSEQVTHSWKQESASSMSRLTKFRSGPTVSLITRRTKRTCPLCSPAHGDSNRTVSVPRHYHRAAAISSYISQMFLLSNKHGICPKPSFTSPLLCSDDACAPRNTVAVATCSLTILCFYCPVPHSTSLCLAELDECCRSKLILFGRTD